MSGLVKDRFFLDSWEDTFFSGVHNPLERWNGWVCPMFCKSEAIRIIEMMSANMDADEVGYSVVNGEPTLDDEGSTMSAELVDGVWMYPIGSWGWVWQAVSEVGA